MTPRRSVFTPWRRLSCLAIVATAAVSADEAPLLIKDEATEQLLRIGDFAQKPGGNLRYFGDRIELHPKALVGIGYDSNVYGSEDDEIDDSFGRFIAGIEVRYDFARTQYVIASAEYESKEYQEESARNLHAGRGAFAYHHEGPSWSHRVETSYGRVDDPVIQTGERVRHDDAHGNIDIERNGEYAEESISFSIDRVDYLEAASTFDERQRDNTQYQCTVINGSQIGEGSKWRLLVVPKYTDYDREDLFWDSRGLILALGGATRFGGRSSVRGEFGLEARVYRDSFQGNPAYDDERVVIPYGKLNGTLAWEDGSDLHANAHSNLEDSVHSNAAWNYGASAGGTYRLLLNARFFADVGYLELRDSGTGIGVIETRRYSYIESGIIYALREGISVRLLGRYVDSTSRTQNDYERFAPSLDVAAIF
jgi:hypothetical protein